MCEQEMTNLQYQALALVQALLGVISPNFRMVWITCSEDLIGIHIVLEIECDEDIEEIEDLKSEFEALQESAVDYKVETTINSGDIEYPDMENTIIVYRRR